MQGVCALTPSCSGGNKHLLQGLQALHGVPLRRVRHHLVLRAKREHALTPTDCFGKAPTYTSAASPRHCAIKLSLAC